MESKGKIKKEAAKIAESLGLTQVQSVQLGEKSSKEKITPL
jgi:hypothetical protein